MSVPAKPVVVRKARSGEPRTVGPQSVGEDYVEADKGRKFRSGGMAGCGTKKMKAGGMTGMPVKKMMMGGMAKNSAYKAGGCVKGDGICKKGHTKGRMV